MKYLLLWVATSLVSLSTQSQVNKTAYKEALAIIDVWLQAQRDFDKLPGIAVSVVDDQEIIFSKGYGLADVEKKTPMQAETVFSICSISKLFTSVAIMQLWEQGKLRLDDSINALIPGYNLKQQYSETVPISIRSLLTHSSGLPREAAYPYWSGPDFYFPTIKEMNAKLGSQQTLYPSSTIFQYSNLGMSLLGEAVTAVSKIEYETYVAKNILQPLQLSNTQPYLPKDLWRGKMSTGYSALYRDGSRKMMPFFQANGIGAAAGYSSTVIDLGRFAAWQFRLLKSDKAELLKPSTLKEMQRVQWVNPDGKLTWGLGFVVDQINDKTFVGHGGSCPGYRSTLLLNNKSKLATAVMINAGGTDPDKYADVIFDMLFKTKESVDSSTKNINLQEYAGSYDNYTWGGETIFMPWKGKLAAFAVPSENPSKSMLLYKYISKDVFRRILPNDDSLGEELRFERDADGNITRLQSHGNYRNKLKL